MISTLLIANRGEIACRIMRTCRTLGIRTVAVYSDADAGARHVAEADVALHIGPSPAAESYLVIDKLIAAAQSVGADAIHPGFGFLAENAAFAQACAAAGIQFVGPSPESIETMGNKRAAKEIVADYGVPILPGYTGTDQSDEALLASATEIGYPLMVKAAAGGGGKGMRLVLNADQLPDGLASARSEGLNSFGSDELTLERALLKPRHVEVQVFGDSHGNIIHLGERDCSIQRRHQKVVEEAPAPGLPAELRQAIGQAAVQAAQAVDYVSAGTVEFLVEDGRFYFLEMNTRIQVEHPVTEMITGLDLVEWQIRVAEGEQLPLTQDEVRFEGHAVEVRLYAEDPANSFLPVVGEVAVWKAPAGLEGIRVDSGLNEQDSISIYYDPMIAKLIAHGPDRKTAIRRMLRALDRTDLIGLTSNLTFLREVIAHDAFVSGALSTRFLQDHFDDYRPQLSSQAETDALIGAALFRYQADIAAGSSRLGPWRNSPNRPLLYPFRDPAGEDEPLKVYISLRKDKFAVTLGENSYLVSYQMLGADQMRLDVDGRQSTVSGYRVGDDWWMKTIEGRAVVTAATLLPKPAKAAGSAGSLKAPMPGVILELMVSAGDAVEVDQPLLKLEAMKMEHTIRSNGAGVVEEIYFQVGDQVDADAQLVRIKSMLLS